MRNLKFGAAAAALFAVAVTALPAGAETTVLSNVTVIDGTGKPAAPASAIVMTDGKIAWVGPMAQLKAPAGATTRDLSGKFVMPGIIDGHVHVGMMKDVTQDVKFYDRANVEADLKTYAAYGVTTVQVAGTDKDVIFDIRRDLRQGRPSMARGLYQRPGSGVQGRLWRALWPECADQHARRSAQSGGRTGRQGRGLHQVLGR